MKRRKGRLDGVREGEIYRKEDGRESEGEGTREGGKGVNG